MGVSRRISNTLQFAAERTLRFVHFCGRKPTCRIRLPSTACPRLVLAAGEIFTKLFGGALPAQFRVLLDHGLAALYGFFGIVVHVPCLADSARCKKSRPVNTCEVGILRLALSKKLWQ
jgi:hypothetical protein